VEACRRLLDPRNRQAIAKPWIERPPQLLQWHLRPDRRTTRHLPGGMDASIGAPSQHRVDRVTRELGESGFEPALNRFSPRLSLRSLKPGSIVGDRQLQPRLHRRCSRSLNDKLDQHHRRGIATARTQLGNTRVSAVDILVPGSNDGEQSLDGWCVIQARHCQTTMVT
jgi:hypothetical protein